MYMIELQGKHLLLVQQKQVLERVRECLLVHGQVQNSMASMIFDGAAQAGGYSMSHLSAKMFILNLGDLYIISEYQMLEQEESDAFEAMTWFV